MAKGLNPDLAFFRSALGELEEYLLSSVIYWPLSSANGESLRGGSIQLTPGNLLLIQKKVNAASWSEESGQIIQPLNANFAKICEKWRANWEKKVAQDFQQRLRLWSEYLDSLAKTPKPTRGDFPYNVRQRVILQLLSDQLGKMEQESKLKILDQRLQNLTQPGHFLWEKELEQGFPKDFFWYLYVKP